MILLLQKGNIFVLFFNHFVFRFQYLFWVYSFKCVYNQVLSSNIVFTLCDYEVYFLIKYKWNKIVLKFFLPTFVVLIEPAIFWKSNTIGKFLKISIIMATLYKTKNRNKLCTSNQNKTTVVVCMYNNSLISICIEMHVKMPCLKPL